MLIAPMLLLNGCTYKQQNGLISMSMKTEEAVAEYIEESPLDWNSDFMQLMSITATALVLLYIPGTKFKDIDFPLLVDS